MRCRAGAAASKGKILLSAIDALESAVYAPFKPQRKKACKKQEFTRLKFRAAERTSQGLSLLASSQKGKTCHLRAWRTLSIWQCPRSIVQQ